MATHSSVLAWRVPGTGKPGGLPSLGLHRVGHDWSDLAVLLLIQQSAFCLECLYIMSERNCCQINVWSKNECEIFVFDYRKVTLIHKCWLWVPEMFSRVTFMFWEDLDIHWILEQRNGVPAFSPGDCYQSWLVSENSKYTDKQVDWNLYNFIRNWCAWMLKNCVIEHMEQFKEIV